MAELGGPYNTCDAAALGGFRKILVSHTQEWQKYEYGFFVLGLPGEEGKGPGLFNAQYMTRMLRIASMPPNAMRCRPSDTL